MRKITVSYNVVTECTLDFTDTDLEAFECDSPERLKQMILDAYHEHRRTGPGKRCPLLVDLWAHVHDDATDNDWSFDPNSLRVEVEGPAKPVDDKESMRQFMEWMLNLKETP